MVGLAVLGQQLDLILKVLCNLNGALISFQSYCSSMISNCENFHFEQQSYPHHFCNTFGKQNFFGNSILNGKYFRQWSHEILLITMNYFGISLKLI